MYRKNIIGIITSFIILFSVTQIISAEEKITLNNNYMKSNVDLIDDNYNQNIKIINKIIWYPRLLLTLLLAPFILLYLIIAIILDIGNP